MKTNINVLQENLEWLQTTITDAPSGPFYVHETVSDEFIVLMAKLLPLLQAGRFQDASELLFAPCGKKSWADAAEATDLAGLKL